MPATSLCHDNRFIRPYESTAILKLELAFGSAEKYLAEHLPGVPVEVVDVRSTYDGSQPDPVE